MKCKIPAVMGFGLVLTVDTAPSGFYCEGCVGSVCLYCCGVEGGHTDRGFAVKRVDA